MDIDKQIRKNLERIRNEIEETKEASGRSHDRIELVAVSKKVTADTLKIAYECGQKCFGESYVQEALEKISSLPYQDISWHLIGRLQKNKIKFLPVNFFLIHSVDSFEIAEEIDKRFSEKHCFANILLQLNLAEEKSKAGCREDEIFSLARSIAELENICIRGLMTMPPYFENPEDVRPYFKRCREIRDELKKEFGNTIGNELSMGMSNDFKIAIEEGATILRIGTAIFGKR